MLSRVADALYWMARNLERAENNSRVLSVQLISMLEADEATMLDQDWEEIIEISASLADYHTRYGKLEATDIIQYLAFSGSNMNSVVNCMTYARENAKATRDMIPEQLWEVINGYYLDLAAVRKENATIQEVQQFLNDTNHTSMAAQGVVESTMTRGVPYTFIKIGKWMERAEKTARILNVVCEKALKENDTNKEMHFYNWLTALRMVNGHDAYIKENPPTMHSKDVLAFIISEATFPRSIKYCMDHVMEAIENLERGKVSHYSEQLFEELSSIHQTFSEMDIGELSLQELMAFLDRFQNQCLEVSRIFSETYYLIEPLEMR
ncbi:alpha-E domain-containing protein [Thalassobacillus hwangdonensis]|uniref:Alpha-E domain-containing protein n=1 Tax=Thalassobacillus hwangdonensis TaxID=546108 RepID=A0ABW3L4P7_9BACI